MKDYGLPASDAQTFVWDVPLGNYFEGIAKQSKNPKAVANWVINNLRAKLSESSSRRESALTEEAETHQSGLTSAATGDTLANLKFKPEALLELVALVEAKSISSAAAQQVFSE